MPVVQVSAWAGITKENKNKIVVGMTKVLKDLGIPKNAITIIINEVPKTNWATGGIIASELKVDGFFAP